MEFPDYLLPAVPIIHHSAQVLQTVFSVCTELMYYKFLLLGQHWCVHV